MDQREDIVPRRNSGRYSPIDCPYGHKYTAENTRIDKRGTRVCKACKRRENAEYRRQNKTGISAVTPMPDRD